jgi:hypothetical protein
MRSGIFRAICRIAHQRKGRDYNKNERNSVSLYIVRSEIPFKGELKPIKLHEGTGNLL